MCYPAKIPEVGWPPLLSLRWLALQAVTQANWSVALDRQEVQTTGRTFGPFLSWFGQRKEATLAARQSVKVNRVDTVQDRCVL